MDMISAVRRVRGQDGYWTKHDIFEAERYIIDAVKNGWKVVPPRTWHEMYVWDLSLGRNLALICSMQGVQYTYDEKEMIFRIKADDRKYEEICKKANITPMFNLGGLENGR
ncbi:MAG: hypothetical protein J6Y02_09645 [Pseudobutyrivibrio sp.]|nr:hypothetical protein [Pseudobutyrivibrio sp.]